MVVFIVLSGFSLALAPARRGWQLGGVCRFAGRRIRRILPAYWAALALSVAVAWLVLPPPGQPAPDLRSLAVNGLFIQNLVGAPSPNRSFWSIAVEAQLYLVFPLLLLVIRRRGVAAMLAVVTAAVVAFGLVSPHVHALDVILIESAPDFAALFALGVVTASIVAGARRARPWALLSLAAAAPVVATIWWQGSVWTLDRLFWVDLAVGPAVACLLAALASGRPAPLVRLLESRPVLGLGACSYSLYLLHGPIVVVVYERLVAGHVGPGVPAFLATAALAVPVAILCAWAFASLFERPWTQRRGRGAVDRRRWADGARRRPPTVPVS